MATPIIREPDPALYVPLQSVIADKREMTETEDYYRLELTSGEALGHSPGQFVEISLPGIGEAPLSVSSPPSRGDGFELVIRRAGRLTNRMHELQVGDKVGVRGPYGTSFPVSEKKLSGRDLLFVAGGIGLVPLRSAILQAFDQADQYNSITILFGCRQPSERLFVEEFSHWRSTPKVKFLETVDRADSSWTGNTGVITTLFPEIEINPENTVALICGPPIMYKFVITELFSRYLPPDQIYVSLERRMKCGIGKCGHCQINDWYTCLEGPVFQFTQLATVPEAFK